MKKFITIILALALVMSLSVPVFAAPNQTEAQTNLSFAYEAVEPVYTVTIPGTLSLGFGDNYLPIEVSDTANLNNKSVAITFEGTQTEADFPQFAYTHYALILVNPNKNIPVLYSTLDHDDFITYRLFDEFGDRFYGDLGGVTCPSVFRQFVYALTHSAFLNQSGDPLDSRGILAKYDKDGVKNLKIVIENDGLYYNSPDYLTPNVTYTGYIIFGIKLV